MNELPDKYRDLGIPVRKSPIRGKSRLKVEYLLRGNPEAITRGPSGEAIVTSISIAELRKILGGDEGDFVAPTGELHHIVIPVEVRDDPNVLASLKFTIINDDGQASEQWDEEETNSE